MGPLRARQGPLRALRQAHGKHVTHLGDGRWWDEDAASWRDGNGRPVANLPPLAQCVGLTLHITKVFIAAAHLNHDAGDCRLRNLRAFCQRCHMLHDKPEHLRQRDLTYKKRRALGDLFAGRYE